MNKLFVLFIASALLLGSCVSSRPDSQSITTPDYNQRQTVNDAHYNRRLNWAGGLVLAGSAAAGGYLGYQNSMFKYQDGGETKDLRSLNAAVGALSGVLLTSFVNHVVLGQGKRKPVQNPERWLKKANKRFVMLGEGTNNFRVINRAAESSYQIHNISDVTDFEKAFPKSRYKDDIVKKCAAPNVLSQEGILSVLSKYPEQPSSILLKNEYLKRTTTIRDYFGAADRFPETKPDIETTARTYIKTAFDIEPFAKRFPNSQYAYAIFQQFKGQAGDVDLWIDAFPNHEKIAEIKRYCLLEFTDHNIHQLYQMSKQYGVINLDDVYQPEFKNRVQVAKKLNDALLQKAPALSDEFVQKTSENLKLEWLRYNLPSADYASSEQVKAFAAVLDSNAWLYPQAAHFAALTKDYLNRALVREEQERVRLAQAKLDSTIMAVKKAVAEADLATLILYVADNGFRPEIESKLTFEEQIQIAQIFAKESRVDMLWEKMVAWEQFGAFLAVYPDYTSRLDDKAYSDLQINAEKKKWCYTCGEIYLKLFTTNPERRAYVEAWRPFAYAYEQEEEARQQQLKLEEAARKARAAEEEKYRVANKSCINKFGLSWGSYELCTVYFADGTVGIVTFVDGYWTLEAGLFATEKLYYESEFYALKAAWSRAKGKGTPSEGRYYPPVVYYSGSSSSSDDSDDDEDSDDDDEEQRREEEEKYIYDYNEFKKRVSLKYEGESDPPLNIGFDGRCPCQEYTLTKENIFFDDDFAIYQDDDGKWWLLHGLVDDGPFLSQEGLLEFIYKNNYKD